jgi:hypothetical protein
VAVLVLSWWRSLCGGVPAVCGSPRCGGVPAVCGPARPCVVLPPHEPSSLPKLQSPHHPPKHFRSPPHEPSSLPPNSKARTFAHSTSGRRRTNQAHCPQTPKPTPSPKSFRSPLHEPSSLPPEFFVRELDLGLGPPSNEHRDE